MSEFELIGFSRMRLLHRGDFASVYCATDLATGEVLAFKVLDHVGELEASRFRRERSSYELLSTHPNIVNVAGVGRQPTGTSYVVMEYFPGGGLDNVLATAGALGADDAAWVGAKMLDALEFAHSYGVVHGDVKPSNILVGLGAIKLGDFGMAKLYEAAPRFDGTEVVAPDAPAAPAFGAPEVVRGEPATAASDLYSLGATLYNLATGRLAGSAGSDAAAGVGPGGTDWALVPERLQAVLRHLLDPEPSLRPGSAAEALAELAPLVPERPSERFLGHLNATVVGGGSDLPVPLDGAEDRTAAAEGTATETLSTVPVVQVATTIVPASAAGADAVPTLPSTVDGTSDLVGTVGAAGAVGAVGAAGAAAAEPAAVDAGTETAETPAAKEKADAPAVKAADGAVEAGKPKRSPVAVGALALLALLIIAGGTVFAFQLTAFLNPAAVQTTTSGGPPPSLDTQSPGQGTTSPSEGSATPGTASPSQSATGQSTTAPSQGTTGASGVATNPSQGGTSQGTNATPPGAQPTVPAGLVNARQRDAEALLKSKGFAVDVREVALQTGDGRDGKVIDVQPPENSQLDAGGLVTLTIGRAGQAPAPQPAGWDVQLASNCQWIQNGQDPSKDILVFKLSITSLGDMSKGETVQISSRGKPPAGGSGSAQVGYRSGGVTVDYTHYGPGRFDRNVSGVIAITVGETTSQLVVSFTKDPPSDNFVACSFA
ncbi:serine/threonine protein kinase [Arthrobacter sp. 35W]|uniref:serine/threonine protein kinase n=1 Tax=Arthrobacter sp. 35W TaxID=1132441 RepID=UPI0003F5F623|nr:serine/threonine protein kinase [Arthrobacter sp. 35W]